MTAPYEAVILSKKHIGRSFTRAFLCNLVHFCHLFCWWNALVCISWILLNHKWNTKLSSRFVKPISNHYPGKSSPLSTCRRIRVLMDDWGVERPLTLVTGPHWFRPNNCHKQSFQSRRWKATGSHSYPWGGLTEVYMLTYAPTIPLTTNQPLIQTPFTPVPAVSRQSPIQLLSRPYPAYPQKSDGIRHPQSAHGLVTMPSSESFIYFFVYFWQKWAKRCFVCN